MAYSYVNAITVTGDVSGASATIDSDAFDLTQGNLCVFALISDLSVTALEVWDDAGNRYTNASAGNISDSGGQTARPWYCLNCNGKTGNVIHTRWAATHTFRGMLGGQYSGLAYFDKAKSQTETPAIATDDLNSTTVTNATDQGSLQWGFGMESNSVGTFAPTAGTGFTSRGTGVDWSGGAQARVEDRRLTTIASTEVTFTPVTVDFHLCIQTIFIEGSTATTSKNEVPQPELQRFMENQRGDFRNLITSVGWW